MTHLLRVYNSRAVLDEITLETLRQELKRDGKCRTRVEESYKRLGGQLKRPRWNDSPEGLFLEDAYSRRVCMLFPRGANPVCLWPAGKQTPYCPDFVVSSRSVPVLPRDMIQKICSYLSNEDLLSCRRINKKWRDISSNSWEGRVCVPKGLVIPEWTQLPLYRQYILYSLRGATMEQCIRLFLRNPAFFAHFFNCTILNTTTNRYRLIPDSFRLAVYDRKRRYWIPEGEDVIKTDDPQPFLFYRYLRQFRKGLNGKRDNHNRK